MSTDEVFLNNSNAMIRLTTLQSGLRVLTESMPGVESVALGVWADAGSCDEHPDVYGQAHFLEHMLFKGTQTRTALALAEEIEDVGGQLNAFTERETTHIFSRVLAEHLPVAVELLGDMVARSTFPQEELERERQVIVEEIRKYESLPEERIHDLIMEGLWQGGALGHSILGTEDSVLALTRPALLACWQRHFAADRVLITAAGKFDHDTLVALSEKAFEGLPNAGAEWPQLPAGTRMPSVLVEEDEEQVNFCWGGHAFAAPDDRNFALAMIDAILGASTTSRLFQEIREKRGLAYDITSYVMGFRHAGLICATAATSPETFPEVLMLVRQEVEKLRRDGITERELARAREQMKAGIALSLESTVDRMRALAQHQLTWGRVYAIPEIVERLNRVTLDEIHHVMDEVLNLDRWTFTAIGPIDRLAVQEIVGA